MMRFGLDIVLFNVQDSATMAGNYTIQSVKLRKIFIQAGTLQKRINNSPFPFDSVLDKKSLSLCQNHCESEFLLFRTLHPINSSSSVVHLISANSCSNLSLSGSPISP